MTPLKLNLGCGLEYKKGYINIDAFDRTVADRVMSALNLEFDDNTFSQVDCMQVLEHLGAAKSIYAVAEVYRVLKPEGLFRLETPDLKSSFKRFLKGDEERRKLVMNWIFGLDMPGMSHKYGFPEELLERMLLETGFVDIEIKQTNTKSTHPSLQATCKKALTRGHQFFTHFRRKLVQIGQVDIDNQVDVIDKEVILQNLLKTTLKDDEANKVLEVTSTSSPTIGQLYLENCVAENLVSKDNVEHHLRILEELVSLGFSKVMTRLFRDMPVIPGRQSETFETVKSMCEQSVKKMLSNNQEVIVELRNTSKKLESAYQTDIFSRTVLDTMSHNLLALGAKAFAQDRLDDAMTHYEEAIRFNRDNTIAYWNLARLRVLNNMQEEARHWYDVTKNMISLIHPKLQIPLSKKIENEIEHTSKGNRKHIRRPVLSLYR